MTTKLLVFTLNLLIVGFTTACQTSPQTQRCTPVTRAAYDVGSGTTKMTVAKVNPCNQSIAKVLEEGQVKVDYRASLEQTKNKELPEAIRRQGLEALSQLKKNAEAFSPISHKGVATAAFREAANGRSFAKQIQQQTAINIQVIPQETEARLGYLAASIKAPSSAQKPVVWDIGGGSQQIIYENEASELMISESDLGAVHFKNLVIKNILGKEPKPHTSPNPLNQKQIQRAISLAQDKARSLPQHLKTKLSTEGVQVLGIGGVHFYSLRNQTSTKEAYTQEDLKRAIQQRTGWTDEQLSSPYATTELTNLILVYGLMKELGITEVRPIKANLTDALLVQ